jgi:hypothetical protein
MGLLLRLLPLLLVSSSAFAADFPELKIKVLNQTGLDFSDLAVTALIECDDPKDGDCGKKKVDGKWNAKTSELLLPATKVGPDLVKGDYFEVGWGKYYSYNIELSSKAQAKYRFAHDLEYFSWENRPGNSTAKMITELKEVISLTLFAVHNNTPIAFESRPEFVGKEIRLRYQKQFISKTPHFSDVAKSWLAMKLPKEIAEDEISVAVPPMVFVLRGDLNVYGEKPRSRTVIHLYIPEEREGRKGYAFRGEFDDGEHDFSSRSHFAEKDAKISVLTAE